MDKQDEHYMNLAYDEAKKAFSRNEIPVGCVVVLEDQVISTGYNRTNETKNSLKHAERVAIDMLVNYSRAQIEDMKIYITIEPCLMCAHYLAFYGIGNVVFGARNPKFGGLGSVYESQAYGISNTMKFYFIKEGVLKEKCIEILERFFDKPNDRTKSNGI